MWESVNARLALLELLTVGALRLRSGQAAVHAWLAELSWTRATGRRGELALVADRRGELVALLDRVWPDWRAEHVALLVSGEPPTPAGWGRLADRRRAGALPDALPERVNRRTAAAATGPGAKSTLTTARLDALGSRDVTDDGLARVRVPPGLVARRGDRALSLDDVAAVFGEIGLPDRALRDGLALEGAVRAVLTVENLGAWRDLPQPEGWLFVHVPGWDTRTVLHLIALLGAVPVVHFGDLDPNGVRIYRHLREHLPDLGWFVPTFWRDLIPNHALARDWPRELDLSDTPPLVCELAAAGLWLEQEPLVLDPRLGHALEAARDAVERATAGPPRDGRVADGDTP